MRWVDSLHPPQSCGYHYLVLKGDLERYTWLKIPDREKVKIRLPRLSISVTYLYLKLHARNIKVMV